MCMNALVKSHIYLQHIYSQLHMYSTPITGHICAYNRYDRVISLFYIIDYCKLICECLNVHVYRK